MNLKIKIAANTLVQIIGRGVGSGVTFLITILVARQFGVEGYGEFTKSMAYVALFYLAADFGFNAVFLKQTTENEKNTGQSFSDLLGLRIFLSLGLIFAALAILSFLPYNPLTGQGFSPLVKLGAVIASLTILTQALFTTANVLFQKNLRYDFSVIASSAGAIATLSLASLFMFLGASLWSVITAYVVGGLLMSFLALNFARRFVAQIRPLFNFSRWQKIFWQTLPLGATLVFNLVYFRVDMMLLALLRPNVEVGIYGLAYKFFEFPLAFVTFFMNSLYPVMLWRLKESEENFKNLIKKISFLLLAVSLLAGAAVFIFAPLITLIQADFTPSILALRVLSFSLPFFFLSALLMWVLVALGQQKLLALFYGLSMLLNVLLNFIFIPRFGYMAAAVITVASELCVLLLSASAVLAFLSKPKPAQDHRKSQP